MRKGSLKPAHRAVKAYYDTLARYADQQVGHEGAVRSAFQTLLADTARAHGWTLMPELSARASDPNRDRGGAGAPPEPTRASSAAVGTRTIRPDGTLRDANSLPRGYWEAKDTADDLDAEIVKKAAKGYSLVNTIFEDTRTAVLFQGKREVLRADLHEPQQLCDLLNLFYAYTEPDIADFAQAVDEFKQRVPEFATGRFGPDTQFGYGEPCGPDRTRLKAMYILSCRTALGYCSHARPGRHERRLGKALCDKG
jgi:hypothetical protein